MENSLLTRRPSRPLTRSSLTGRLLALLVLLLGSTGAWAQTPATYGFTQSTGAYTAITGGTVAATAIAGDNFSLDDSNVVLPAGTIPFTFTYNGVGYTGLTINSNGYVTFGATAPSVGTYTPISSTTGYSGAISGFGQDMVGDATAGSLGEIRYQAVGTSPNRTFVVQFTNFKRYISGIQSDNLNFQIRLSETSNVIDLVYGAFTLSTTTGTEQVGLRGASGVYNNRTSTTSWLTTNAGTTSSASITSSATIKPVSGLTYTFTPPGTCLPPTRLVAGSLTASGASISFTAPATAPTNYTVSISPAGGTITPATPTASPVAISGLTASTTYTVTISSNCSGTASIPTSVTFTTAANCAAPTALATNTVTATSANLTFTAAASGVTNYTVTTLPATTTQTVTSATTGSPVVLSGLTPGTAYTVRVVSNCTAGGNSTVATTTFSTLVTNDNPTGAIAIPITANCTTPTQGTNVGATTTTVNGYANPGCGIASSPKDVWYTFTTAATGPAATAVQINITGNPAGQVRVFSTTNGAAGPFTEVACSAGNNNNVVAPDFSVAGLTASTTYYVFVSGYGSTDTQGPFTLCVTNPPACGDPTNPTVTIGATTISVAFAPGAGNTSFTFTATPTAGGTPITNTGTASPVVVSGLTPNTSYDLSLVANCAGGLTTTPITGTFTTNLLPPANDDCAGAISLTPAATCVTTSGTTVGATASTVTGTCVGTADDDVWYSFVATNTTHTITVVGATGFDAVVNLRSGACPGVNVGSCQDNTGGGGTETIAATGLTVGDTYYVRVFDYFTSPGTFTICITQPASCAAPTAVATNTVTATTANVTFTAGNGNTGYTVTYTPAGGTAQTATGTASPIALTGLTAGTTYSVTVTGNCAGGLTATSTPAVSFTTTAAPPANDDCTAAVTLTSATTCTATSGTVAGATQSLAPILCNGFTSAGPAQDVFYSFTATGTTHTIAVTGTFDGVLEVLSGACGSTANVGCSDVTGNNETLTLNTLTSGTTYLVRYYPYSANPTNKTFTICVTNPAACAAPTAVATNTVTATTANVTFTAGNGNTGYTVTYTPAGGTAQTATGTASPIALTGLTAGTTYSVTVTGNCAGGLTATSSPAVTFTTAFATPANDLCANATVLTCGQTVTGTTQGATTTGAPTGTCGTSVSASGGVFYTYTGTGDIVTVSTCSGPTATSGSGDTKLFVYSGTCAALTCVGGNDDIAGCANNRASAVTFTSVAGTQYYFYVQGFSTTLPFGLSVTCVAPPCNAPTNLTAGSITQTSASVSFTGSSSATGYTVTTSPVTTTQTLGASATSVSFTGLSASTAYTVSIVSNCAAGATSSAATVSFTTTAATPTDLVVTNGQNISASGAYNNITVQNGGILTLNGATSATGAVQVQNGGTLNTNCQTLDGSGTFTLAAGGTLGICTPAGISLSGTTGAVQLTGTRTYASDATYVYNGTVAQVTGSGLPATVRNLTVNNATGLSLSSGLSITQVARLQSGNLSTSAQPFILLSDANGTALVDNTGGIVTGTGTMQRAVTNAVTGPAYRHFSSPVSNTTLADLTTTGFTPTFNSAYNTSATPSLVTPFPTVFGYNQNRVSTVTSTYGPFDKGWFSPSGASDVMQPTRGYTVNAPATATPIDFVGLFNNGAQNTGTLIRGTDAEAGWHLLGNPYPSPLDWSTVAAGQRPGMDAAMYVYQSTGQYAGNYRSYANGVGASPLISAGSGYFARVTTGTGSVNLTNANRVTTFGPEPAFGRGTADTRPQLHLRLSGAGLTDEAYLYQEAGATAGVDAQYDAVKLANPAGMDLASLNGTTALAINGLPLATTTDVVVPLSLRVPQGGSFSFEVPALDNFGTATVYLRDALTGSQQVLTTGTRYQFTLATAASGNGRFSVVFRAANVLANRAELSAATVSVYPNPAHGHFTVLLPPLAGQTKVQATLLNVLGQVVQTRTIGLTAAGGTAEFNTQDLAKGVYMIRLQANNQVMSKAVVVE